MREIYLDNAATTKVDADVAELAIELMQHCYGNPSALHKKGTEAAVLLDTARKQVAALLGCTPQELVFCSGGTEANNLALLGAARARQRRGKTIVVGTVEHASVLQPLKYLEECGWTVKRIAPLPNGSADIPAMINAVDNDTVLISAMLVNSETGSITAVDKLAAQARRKQPGILVHCDAVQGFGKLLFTVNGLGSDLLTISGHKLYAPKGSGALYIRSGVRIHNVLYGGGHENGLRPGTEPLPALCGMGKSAQNATRTQAQTFTRMQKLSEYFVNKAAGINGICINSPGESSPYIQNISLPGWRSQILLNYLSDRGIHLSSGSACAKGARSRILTAMGLPLERIDSALRVSFCKENTPADIDALFEALGGAMRDVLKNS